MNVKQLQFVMPHYKEVELSKFKSFICKALGIKVVPEVKVSVSALVTSGVEPENGSLYVDQEGVVWETRVVNKIGTKTVYLWAAMCMTPKAHKYQPLNLVPFKGEL